MSRPLRYSRFGHHGVCQVYGPADPARLFDVTIDYLPVNAQQEAEWAFSFRAFLADYVEQSMEVKP